WRDYAYSEFDFANPISPTPWQEKHHLSQSNSNCAILREERFTLVHFAAGMEPMLFDAEGRGELENIAEKPEFAGEMLRLTQKLLSHRMQNTDHTLSTTMITKEGPVETLRPR
ncbi:MAG: phosphonate monoester hydrolase, partial [Halocynthiibacter sp.]